MGGVGRLVEDEFRGERASPSCPSPATGRRARTRPGSRSSSSTRRWSGPAAVPYVSKSRTGPASAASRPASTRGRSSGVSRKPGRDLREKVELWLAWRRVAREVADGTLGGELTRATRRSCARRSRTARRQPRMRCGGGYRAVLADSQEPEGLEVIDLGAGHSSSGGDAVRAGHRGAQVRGPSERIRRHRIHRAELAASARGYWRLAPREPAAELPERPAHAPDRS